MNVEKAVYLEPMHIPIMTKAKKERRGEVQSLCLLNHSFLNIIATYLENNENFDVIFVIFFKDL